MARSEIVVAYVTARFRVDGELVERLFENDVTDEYTPEAAEDLADRLYWKNCHGVAGFFDVTSGGIRFE